MLIEYTPEEQKKKDDIRDSYLQRLRQITKALDPRKAADRKLLKEERAQLLLEMTNELQALDEQFQKKRFSLLGGDPDVIIQNARDQAEKLLELEYHELSQYGTQDDLITLGITYREGDSFVLGANFMAELIRDELKLHLTALHFNEEKNKELLAAILDVIENSPLTNDEEITTPPFGSGTGKAEKVTDIVRFRRSPLMDITTYGIMNDNVAARLIQDEDIFEQQTNGQLMLKWSVPEGRKKDPVVSYVALTYEGTESKLTKKLTAFDNAVYDAISTRYFYWIMKNPHKPLYITPAEVWRTMNGKNIRDDKARPSKAQERNICASLDKMRFTRFFMDITEEVRAFDLRIDDDRIENGKIDGYLLNSIKVEFSTEKGRTVSGYRINEEPLLYTYNKAKKHILFVPYQMLDTSAKTSDSEFVTEFRTYLLRQIQLIKNGQHVPRIMISSIYVGTGIEPPETRIEERAYKDEATKQQIIRRTRKADRSKIEALLDAWTEKGWIQGYDPVIKRQTVTGYDIRP